MIILIAKVNAFRLRDGQWERVARLSSNTRVLIFGSMDIIQSNAMSLFAGYMIGKIAPLKF